MAEQEGRDGARADTCVPRAGGRIELKKKIPTIPCVSFCPTPPHFIFYKPKAGFLADIFSVAVMMYSVCINPPQKLPSPVARAQMTYSIVINVYCGDQKKKLTFKSFILVNLHSLKKKAKDHRPALHSASQNSSVCEPRHAGRFLHPFTG